MLSLMGSAAILSLVVLAGVGAWARLRRDSSRSSADLVLTWLLVSLPFYLLIFSAVADGVQSRYRAQAEAALVLLAVWGFATLRARFMADPASTAESTQQGPPAREQHPH